MTTRDGDFVWYELMTTEADAAQAFYAGLIGWSFEDASFNDTGYRVFSTGSGPVGGFLQLFPEMTAGGDRPAWMGYIHVSDLDAALAGVTSEGGTVVMGPGEVPGVGPFAMIADRQGARLYLIEDRSGQESQAFAKYAPQVGHCAWNELVTTDPDDALAFYGSQFGMVIMDRMDMGPMGEYRILRNGEDRDFAFGAMMQKPDAMPVSAWGSYFRVPDINAAASYIASNGGQVINGPMEIPGGEYALNGIDPQGAIFGLVGPAKD